VLARFVPIVRTFAPPVAGAADMRYPRYVSFSAGGALLWVWSMVLTGFWLGRAVPNIDRNIHYVIAVVVFLSILPAVVETLRHRRAARS
jgi:membrane-associated protein